MHITFPPCQVHEVGDHGHRGLPILVDVPKGTVSVSVVGSSTIAGNSLFVSGTHSILLSN